MSDLADFVRRQQYVKLPNLPQGVHSAFISRVSPAGEIFAVIMTQDRRVEWGPLIAAEGFVPTAGEECLIAITPQPGGHWLVQPSGAVGGGGDDGDLNYVHTQGAPSASHRTLAHGLGKYPSVSVVDTGDSVVIPDISYIDINTVQLDFGSPTSGKAFVN